MPRKTKSTEARKLSWIAHHEAAHKVSAIRLGCDRLGFVTIRPQGETCGVANSEDPLFRAGHFEGEVWVPDSDEVDKGIVELFSGYYGAVRAGQPRDAAKGSASSDLDKIGDLLQFTSSPRAALRKRASRLVASSWKAIHAVALELLEHTTLDDCDPALIVELADGRKEAATELARFRALKRL